MDDGGNDDLEEILSGLPAAILSTGGSGSAAVARNRGAEDFTGSFLVFIDADVLVDSRCIETLIEPLCSSSAEATVGNYSRNVRDLPFAARYKQLYISKIYQRRAGYLQNEFWTAIGAIDACVFRRMVGFDPRFKGAGGEDTDLGRRLTESGFRVLAVPAALGDHRHLLSLWQLLKNDWRKGLLAMENHFESDGSLSENRHATGRDMLAVGSATMLIAALLAMPFAFAPMHESIIFSLLAALYLSTRADVLRVFSSQGVSFVFPACGLMFLLDATRSGCFITGIYRRFFVRSQRAATNETSNEVPLEIDDRVHDEEYLHSRLSI
ncbi:glycosyl transferase [Acidisarcina polymorpha]|uniref:Glycosyl transferase n=1 Tax=Acidisarcina polymorpha TaxID=2211140 RepID=A0A2Z5G3Z6_9BACT|nr:glycosyl transferase [Acidisarcina polymorpha]